MRGRGHPMPTIPQFVGVQLLASQHRPGWAQVIARSSLRLPDSGSFLGGRHAQPSPVAAWVVIQRKQMASDGTRCLLCGCGCFCPGCMTPCVPYLPCSQKGVQLCHRRNASKPGEQSGRGGRVLASSVGAGPGTFPVEPLSGVCRPFLQAWGAHAVGRLALGDPGGRTPAGDELDVCVVSQLIGSV